MVASKVLNLDERPCEPGEVQVTRVKESREGGVQASTDATALTLLYLCPRLLWKVKGTSEQLLFTASRS